MELVLKALSDPTRRAILELVALHEATAGDIATRFEISRPGVSQHLKVLEGAGLVEVEQAGTRRYYRTRPEGMTQVKKWIDGFHRTSRDSIKIEVQQEEWRKRSEARKGNRSIRDFDVT